MSDYETDLHVRLSKLENAFVQQTEGMALHVAGTNLLTQQVHALILVNTAMAAALRDRKLLVVEQIRATALGELSDEEKMGPVAAHIDALLGTLTPADARASNEAAAVKLKEAARDRFRVIDGGAPGEDTQG